VQELVPTPHLEVTKAASAGFDDEMRSIIRNAVNPNASEAEFELFLEVAARYQLNPLNGELYLGKMPAGDGSPSKFVPIVGRAGYLAVAQRQATYRGLRADVVRGRDEFAVAWHEQDSDGTTPKVIHAYSFTTSEDGERSEEGASDREARTRGKIIGSWCKVFREGKTPTFFYASWNEYAPRDMGRQRFWKQHPSEAMRKCAISNAVREAFSLSGLYDEAEMARALEAGDAEPGLPVEPDYGEGELGERIKALVHEAQTLGLSYRPQKVRLTLEGATEEERKAFADQLEREVEQARGEEPVDAEVVPDHEKKEDGP
jgi:phage recombination protein Bet